MSLLFGPMKQSRKPLLPCPHCGNPTHRGICRKCKAKEMLEKHSTKNVDNVKSTNKLLNI